MTNRLDNAFASLRSTGKKAFVAYVCAGDPSLEHTLEVVRTLADCGVDVIELGLPFSDPLADGIVNQMAAGRALAAGATTAGVLELVRRIRTEWPVPLVLFTYLNPVYAYGFTKFHADAAAAGADGVLLLDLPPDEDGLNDGASPPPENCAAFTSSAPTTPPDRMRQLAAGSEGFIYYISREGVTGAQEVRRGFESRQPGGRDQKRGRDRPGVRWLRHQQPGAGPRRRGSRRRRGRGQCHRAHRGEAWKVPRPRSAAHGICEATVDAVKAV